MKRRRENFKVRNRKFTKTAVKVHSKNMLSGLNRGGTRL